MNIIAINGYKSFIAQNYLKTNNKKNKIIHYKKDINNSKDFNQSTGVAVRIEKFSDSSIDLLVRCFTDSNSWSNSLEVKERLAIQIKQIVENNNASFAFPSQSIYVEKK